MSAHQEVDEARTEKPVRLPDAGEAEREEGRALPPPATAPPGAFGRGVPAEVLARLNDHYVLFDRQWRYVYVNDGAAELLRRPREELIGACIWELFPEAVGNLFYRELHRAMAEQRDLVFDHYYPPFDRWFENRVYASPDGVAVFSTDVTERKRAEEAERRSAARYRALVEASNQVVWSWSPADGTGDFAATQQWWEALTGQSPAAQYLDGWLDAVVPEDREHARAVWTKALQAGGSFQAAYRVRTRSGGTAHVVSRAVPVHGPDGSVQEWVGTLHDGTASEEASEALRLSEERFSKAFRASPDAFAITRREDGRIIEVNESFERALGYLRDEVVGRTPAELGLYDPVVRSLLLARLQSEGHIRDFEVDMYTRAGACRRTTVSVEGITIHGEPCLLTILRDITERRRIEAALDRERELLQKVFERIPVMIVLYRSDLQVLQVNRAFTGVTGWTAEEARQTDLLAACLPDPAARAAARALIGGAHEGWKDLDVTARDGRVVETAWTVLRLSDETYVGIGIDLHDRVAAERALRASEREFRAMFELAGSGKAQSDPGTGRFTRVNRRFCEITGYTEAELLTRTSSDITHPEDRAQDETAIRPVLGGEQDHWRVEKRYVRPDGDVVWVSVTGSLLRDDAGRPLRTIATIHDITDRHRAERERELLLRALEDEQAQLRLLNETLEQRVAERTRDLTWANRTLEQRNRELQDFAYVASHDLQEPLRKIRAFADMLGRDYAAHLDEEGQLLLERMASAAARMSQLITDLLTFSRVATRGVTFELVDLGQVVGEVLQDLEVRLAESGGQVEVGALCTVEADALQMRQLFQNLIGNALKFCRDGVPPVVRLRASTEAPAAPGTPLFCRIEVEDNGVGFDDRYVERIFSPFQRLHGRRYEGTGMGLAICRRIVERHGGAITATSTPDQGSRFVVTLPVHADEPAA